MDKYITYERTGLKYELVGNYNLIAGDDEPKKTPNRNMGTTALTIFEATPQNSLHRAADKRQAKYDYLAERNEQAEDMFFRLVKEHTQKKGITEKLKEKDQMLL